MTAMASRITDSSIVCSAGCSSWQQKIQSSSLMAFCDGNQSPPATGGFTSQRVNDLENLSTFRVMSSLTPFFRAAHTKLFTYCVWRCPSLKLYQAIRRSSADCKFDNVEHIFTLWIIDAMVYKLTFYCSLRVCYYPWWRHQMKKNFRVTGLLSGEFTGDTNIRDADIWCFLHLNKRLSIQSWGWCSEMPPSSWCRYCNALVKRTLVYQQLRCVVNETHLTKSTHSHPGSVDGILSQENAVILPIGSTSVLIF